MSEIAIDKFFSHAKFLAKWLRDFCPTEIVLLHHNDADGISAGAILSKALYRAGFRIRRIALEKPYPMAIEVIADSFDDVSRGLLLFADFASGMLPLLDQVLPASLQVLVLDHHQINGCASDRINLLNPLGFGISGGHDCTASIVAYLFAKALSEENRDLAAIALVGVGGDGQYQQGFKLTGLNRVGLRDATEELLFCSTPVPQLILKNTYPLSDIVRSVNALGSIGYFEGGVDIALKGLADGWGIEADTRGKEYQERFDDIVRRFLAQVELKHEGRLTWFVVPDTLPAMGVKTVGLFCEELIKSKRIDGERYLLGIQAILPLALGFGKIEFSEEKVSMRTTPALNRLLETQEAPSLVEILPVATRAVSGFVDACHPSAAATTIPIGCRTEFLRQVAHLCNTRL